MSEKCPGIFSIRLLNLILLLVAVSIANAQSARLDWVKTMNSSDGRKLAIDSNKAVIVMGDFIGTVDFDPGPGVFNLTSQGAEATYIAKYDSSGNFIWAKQLASPNGIFGADLKIDRNGDLLILGGFNDTADFDPGPGTAFLYSVYEKTFLLRLDNNGNFKWVKELPNQLNTMDIDPFGNILLGGSFAGTVDFDPGPGTFMASSGGDNTFAMAVVKLDNAGNFIWMKQVSSLGAAQVQTWGLRTDPEGSVLFAGNFSSAMDFDPGPGTVALTSAGSDDAFVLKLDSQGNYKWAFPIGGAGSDKAFGLEVDKYGNVYTTGIFQDSVDFDPGPGIYRLKAGPIRSCFISKLDKNGNFVYAKSLQGGESHGQSLALDSSNNLYISGDGYGPTDLDPGPGISMVNAGYLFAVKLDSSGNFAWAAPDSMLGGMSMYSAYSAMKVDIMKNVYLTGTFAGTMDFDPTSGNYIVIDSNTTGYFYSTYLQQLSQCHNTLKVINEASCDTFSLNGVAYRSPGQYYQTLANSVGCDSIIQLTLTRKEAYSTLSVTTCGSYVWNGKTLGASGTYRDTFPSSTACDSVAELDLTLTSKTSVVTDTACGSYQWGGTLLTASGTYTDTFRTAVGCDSIVTMALVLLPNAKPYLGKDTVLCKGDTLRISPGLFLSYTWSDNSTTNSLLVKETGTYWVQVMDTNGCRATDTIQIARSGQCGCSLGPRTKVYPEPFIDYLYIDKETTSCEVRLDLYNMMGQQVRKDILLADGLNKIQLIDLAPAMYVYKLSADGKTLLTGKALKLK